MPDPVAPSRADDESTAVPDELAEAGVYPTTREGFDHSLVVLALGQACWLMPSAAGYRLLVAPAVAGRVRAELASYDRESAGWPPRPAAEAAPRTRQGDLLSPLLWALAVLAVFSGQDSHPRWLEDGALDAAAVCQRGEIWRCLTSLFLHADGAHLASNLVAGVGVFTAVLAGFGTGRGWRLLALASLAGNLAVAALHWSGPYRSIGASTAVFAALGMLTGRAVRAAMAAEQRARWRQFFVPAAAGLTMLALYGAGNPPTDVLAHCTGFAAGAAAGLAAGRPEPVETRGSHSAGPPGRGS